MTRLLAVLIALAAVGCSSRAPTPTRPPGGGEGSATQSGAGGATTADAGANAGSGVLVPPATKVTEADCLALFDHMIAIDIKDRPPDHQLTQEQIASTRAAMEKELMSPCLEQSPQRMTCLRAAATNQAARACEQTR